jgi:CRISPR-associated protein Cmr2
VFANARDPLSQILAEAHRLLDEVAKEENGRASLAASVYRGGTAALQWTTTWERSSSNGTRKDAVECLCRVACELDAESGKLSGSLVHDLRRMISLLCGTSSLAPGAFAKLGEGIDIAALVHAEIEHRFGHHEGSSETVDVGQLASLVCDVLGRSRRKEMVSSYVGMDGLLLGSFLASGGRGEEHGP